jgi:hypothetical protein
VAGDVLRAGGTAGERGAAALGQGFAALGLRVRCARPSRRLRWFVLMRGAEDAEVAIAAERGVVHGGFAILCVEAVEEPGVGTEFLCATVKLARIAEIDEAALVHAVDGAAEFDVLVAK